MSTDPQATEGLNLIFYSKDMKQFQYIGEDHTMVRLIEWGAKTKVVYWEIIESDIKEDYFIKNNFKRIEQKEKKSKN